ncbi:MAG: patatin-like phospholipase family protein, partial [Desulfuromonadaceae bacterium]|nr:patatin-like phospholipase family protein [Desulfuromonadaceae bacterium]
GGGKSMPMFARPKVGLALGGGAARGLSHIGVLEAFEECGLPIDVISGTSMGAIIGAMYATEPNAAAVKRRFIAYLQSDAFKESRFDYLVENNNGKEGFLDWLSHFAKKSVFYTLLMTRNSFIHQETTRQNFALLIDDIDLGETPIPFCTTALDLVRGEEYIFKKGNLRQAVTASCAIPGLLPPVEIDGRFLIDGGWINAVPVKAGRSLGADVVIGVDVYSDLDPFVQPDTALDVAARAEAVTRWALTSRLGQKADCLLTPEAGSNHWADFSQFDEAVASGRNEVYEHLRALRQLTRRKLRIKRAAAPQGDARKQPT